MKVFLLGATGNLGSRLVTALLSHGHKVVVYVRSPQKLQTLFSDSTCNQLTIIQGDATNAESIKRALIDSGCDAVVTAAGVAKMAPWAKGDLPVIFRAIFEAVREAGEVRKKPFRTWFLGGTGVLYYPATETMLSNYIPIFLEHRQNIALLRELPPNTIDWSMLCPGNMLPESNNLDKTSIRPKLVVNAQTPPSWQHMWYGYVPLIGRTIELAMNFARYDTTLEQNADFIARDLIEGSDSQFVGKTVGIISPST